MRTSTILTALAAASSAAYAKVIVVTVGTNLTSNGSDFSAAAVFVPNVIRASLGDQVLFNFTQGTHSVIQSTFDQPCVPISQTNTSVNGFNTGPRPAGNFESITTFPVDIDLNVINQTLWFFDQSTCGNGGVGAINVNNSSWQPYNAFVRNAVRLFGPHANDTKTQTSSSTASSGSETDSSDPAEETDGTGAALRTSVGSTIAVLAAAALAVLL